MTEVEAVLAGTALSVALAVIVCVPVESWLAEVLVKQDVNPKHVLSNVPSKRISISAMPLASDAETEILTFPLGTIEPSAGELIMTTGGVASGIWTT